MNGPNKEWLCNAANGEDFVGGFYTDRILAPKCPHCETGRMTKQSNACNWCDVCESNKE